MFRLGLYQGNGKPHDSNDFLKAFVEEAKSLMENGFIYQNKAYKIKFHA